jgi:hypothetical protein
MKPFFILLFLIASVNSFSQDSTESQKNINRIATMQHKQVLQRIKDISPEQQQQLISIFEEFEKELSALKNKRGRVKLQYFQTINSKKDKKVLKVLSAEQRKTYEELIKEWKEKMQQRKGKRK